MSYTEYAQTSAPPAPPQGGYPPQPSPPPPASPYAPASLPPPAAPMMTQMPNARPTLFGAMPCPHCGAKMTWETSYSRSAMRWFGVVGILLIYPWTASYICPQHGEVGERVFPPAHKSVATMRKVLSTVAGAVLLALGVWVLILLQ